MTMNTQSRHVRQSATNQLEVATWKAGALHLTNRVTSKNEITVDDVARFKRNLARFGLRVAACGVGRLTRVK